MAIRRTPVDADLFRMHNPLLLQQKYRSQKTVSAKIGAGIGAAIFISAFWCKHREYAEPSNTSLNSMSLRVTPSPKLFVLTIIQQLYTV